MNNIQLVDIFFVDKEYSHKHPHMIHHHDNVLELLYIYSENGRYIVGNYEYAVTAGDFIICNSNIPHGEDPFQNHQIQTYCLVLSGATLDLSENERPIVSLGKENPFGELLPGIYNLFHKKSGYSEVCRHFAVGIYLLLQRMLIERAANPNSVQQKREQLIYRILNYINEHYAEALTLDLIGEAQSLLVETSIPIQDIEYQLGFNDNAHFSKMFKQYVGVTPKEYRKHFSDRRRRK